MLQDLETSGFGTLTGLMSWRWLPISPYIQRHSWEGCGVGEAPWLVGWRKFLVLRQNRLGGDIGGREGAFSNQPLNFLMKKLFMIAQLARHLFASRRGQQSVLNEGVSPGRSFPSSLRRSGWQAAPPPSRYFSLLPAFCSPGHHHQYSHTLGDLASYKEEILFTISQPCAANIASSYMIFRTDPWIFDFPLQIPLSPILTSRWIVTIFTFQHSPRTGEIFLLRKTPATQHKDKNLSESIMFSYKVRNWLEKHPKGKSQFLFLLRVRRNES